MPTIDLLRHGDTGQRGFRGQLDDALLDDGWAQMRAAVRAGQWDAIVSSPLQRCAAFAQELATQRNLPLLLDVRLSEYHFGEWQAIPVEVIAEQQGDALAAFWANPVACPPPGAEAFAGFEARIAAAITAVTRMPEQQVLVVTHGGVIRWLRSREQGGNAGTMSGIEVPHASLHRLQWPVLPIQDKSANDQPVKDPHSTGAFT